MCHALTSNRYRTVTIFATVVVRKTFNYNPPAQNLFQKSLIEWLRFRGWVAHHAE